MRRKPESHPHGHQFRRLSVAGAVARAGFVMAALAMAAVLVHPVSVGAIGFEGAAESAGASGVSPAEWAAGSQTTEPEGVDTTDPEASDEDAQGAPSWLGFVITGAITAGFLTWYLRRLRDREGEPGSE